MRPGYGIFQQKATKCIFHKLSKILQVTAQEIQAAIKVIKELNPRTCAALQLSEISSSLRRKRI